MGYIESGKEQGATVALGGERHGTEGYFINPTIFTDVKPDMKIVQEEIFGPVAVVIKFEDEDGESFSDFLKQIVNIQIQMWSNRLTTVVRLLLCKLDLY